MADMMECAEEMAAALRDAQTILVALVIPDMSRPSGDIYFRAVEAEAKGRAALARYEASK